MKKILLVLSLILCLFFLTCCEDGKVSADKIKQAGDALAKTGNSAEAQRIIVENAQTEVEELVKELVKELDDLPTENSVKSFTADSTSSSYAQYDEILQKFNALSAKYSHNDKAWEAIRDIIDAFNEECKTKEKNPLKDLSDKANAYARAEGVALLKTLLLFLLDYNDTVIQDVNLGSLLGTYPLTINLNLSLRDFLEGMQTKFKIETPKIELLEEKQYKISIFSYLKTIKFTPFYSDFYSVSNYAVYDTEKIVQQTEEESNGLVDKDRYPISNPTDPTLSMKNLSLEGFTSFINYIGNSISNLGSGDVSEIFKILQAMGLGINDVPIAFDYADFQDYNTKKNGLGVTVCDSDFLNDYSSDRYEKRFTLSIDSDYTNVLTWENGKTTATYYLGKKFSKQKSNNPSKPSIPGTSNPTDVTMDGITDDAISTLLSMLLSMYGEVLTDYGTTTDADTGIVLYEKPYSVASLLNDLYFINALATVETVMGDLGSALNDTDSELFNSTYKDFFKGITLDDYQLTYDSFATQENSGKIIKLLLELSKGHYFPQQNEVLYRSEDSEEGKKGRIDKNCQQIIAIATFYQNLMNIEAETVLKYFNEIEGIASNLDSAMKYNKNLYLYSNGQTAYNMSDKVKAIYKASENASSIPTANIIALLNCSSTDPSETLSYALYKIDDNEIVDAIRYNLTNENLNLDIDSFLDGTIEKLLKSLDM